ncbi:hypothetical protein QVD17_18683 [Tagetes erecta]|uniref:Transposase, Ptta/En/Spm, plant n=1 Tax=Tagetes erecta TaxID=13708 RepID=A0AAD8KL48_TARER|nr:hypothetical protein QVD17_18683 [Tagetes erecta]
MLVMMVAPLTRKRSQEQDLAQPRIQSPVDGSSSQIVQQPTHKRSSRMPITKASAAIVAPIPRPVETAPLTKTALCITFDASLIVNQHLDANQPPIHPRTRRGPSLNLKATETLENLPKGSKIRLTMDTRTKGFVGTSATQFSTECGIVIRTMCPMKYHKWDSIPSDEKDILYEKLETKFNLLRLDRVFMEYVNDKLHRQWKRTRGKLSEYWKKNGGKTNPRLARSKMKPDCRSTEDWDHLCNYWELESTRTYSDQMEVNRAKQVIASRGGSRSIANHVFHMTNHETQVQPTPLELYHKLHFNAKKQDWENDDERIQYENIIRHKDEAMTKLISEVSN